jgi:hypothetical protein
MTNERNVAFGYVEEEKLGETIQRQQSQDHFPLGSIAEGVPQFIAVNDYTTFRAEYTLQDENVVVHFFLPPEFKEQVGEYWTIRFPRALDATARAYFSADKPRLQAKYTEEMKSWWFRALSYGHIIDLKGFVMGFFDELDRALERQA